MAGVNKRFLGLGFTFTATDKGLEKKLKGIQKAISGINESLEQMGENATDAMSIGSTKATKSKKTKAANTKSAATTKFAYSKCMPVRLCKLDKPLPVTIVGGSRTTPIASAPVQTVKEKPVIADVPKLKNTQGLITQLDKLSPSIEENKNVFEELRKVLGKNDYLWAYEGHLRDLNVQLDENGKISDKSKKNLMKFADVLQKMSKLQPGVFTDALERVKSMFVWVKQSFDKLKNSADRFLQSIGVDIASMIPEQVKALFNVFKTGASVIFDWAKKGFMSILGGDNKKLNDQLKQLKMQNKYLGGRGGVIEVLEDIKGNTEKKEKVGFFGKIKDFLSKIGGAIGGLIGSVGAFFAGKWIGPLLSGFSSLGKMLWQGTKFLGKFVKPLFIVGVAVSALIGLFAGLSKGLEGTWEKLKSLGSSLGIIIGYYWDQVKSAFAPVTEFLSNAFGKLGEWISTGAVALFGQKFVETAKLIAVTIGDVLIDMLKKLVSYINPINIFKDIKQGWEYIGEGIGSVVSGAVGGAEGMASRKAAELQGRRGDLSNVIPIRKGMANAASDAQSEQTMLMKAMVKELSENNEYQRDIAANTGKKGDGPIININNAARRSAQSGDAQVNNEYVSGGAL